jgi:hypothetical protein
MSEFSAAHSGRERGGYVYEIRHRGHKVAELWHDFRGEEPHIRISSLAEWTPFEKILEGGGPEPLRLSTEGEALLSEYLSRHRAY